MWRFCYENSYLPDRVGAEALDKFLESVSEDERYQYEEMDMETFRRGVKELDELIHPEVNVSYLSP